MLPLPDQVTGNQWHQDAMAVLRSVKPSGVEALKTLSKKKIRTNEIGKY